MSWLSDIHLNFLEHDERESFYGTILEKTPGCVLISGDIAEAKSVAEILTEMSEYLSLPIYFVLGNHDYYFAGIEVVTAKIKMLCKSSGSRVNSQQLT